MSYRRLLTSNLHTSPVVTAEAKILKRDHCWGVGKKMIAGSDRENWKREAVNRGRREIKHRRKERDITVKMSEKIIRKQTISYLPGNSYGTCVV